MGLDAFDRVDDADCAVEDWEASIDLESEVLVAGCINQVDGLWGDPGWAVLG
jgi:hypothetical protein